MLGDHHEITRIEDLPQVLKDETPHRVCYEGTKDDVLGVFPVPSAIFPALPKRVMRGFLDARGRVLSRAAENQMRKRGNHSAPNYPRFFSVERHKGGKFRVSIHKNCFTRDKEIAAERVLAAAYKSRVEFASRNIAVFEACLGLLKCTMNPGGDLNPKGFYFERSKEAAKKLQSAIAILKASKVGARS